MLERLLLGLLILWGLRSVLSRNSLTSPAQTLEAELSSRIRKFVYPKSYVDFWMDVSRMETANFSSYLFKNNNNPWGMKVAKRRETTQANSMTNENWARYDNLSDAATDIFLWMDAVNFSKTISQLFEFVVEMKRHGYFDGESSFDYYQKILAIKK